MKKLLMFIALLCAAPLFAESVFLKNGSIVEGTIEKETSSSIRLKSANGVQNISKKEVIRTLTSDAYKKKLYIYKNDLSLIEGYIVDENRSQYTMRRDMLKNDETVLLKSDIKFYSRMNISGCSSMNEGEYKAMDTPYDWFYMDISISYLTNPFLYNIMMTKLSFGISNSFSDWYHIGAHLVLSKFPSVDELPDVDDVIINYQPAFLSGIITAGLNFIYNDRIGVQPYAGIGYNNGIQYSLGISAPIRFSGYRWISVFIQYDRTTLSFHDNVTEGESHDNFNNKSDDESNYPAEKDFNMLYAGIKFSL